MKLSFSSCVYCSSPVWLPAYPIEYVIEKLSGFGYDGVELMCASPVAYPPYMNAEDRKRVAALLKAKKLSVSSVLPFPGGGCGNNVASPIAAEREQTIKNYKESIDLGHDLGARICLYIGGWVIWGVDQDQAWEWSRECLVEIAKYAKTKGITLAVEPTPSDSNLVENADDAIRMMRESKCDNVKLMFDTIHALYRGDNMTDYVDKMGKDLVHLHISDTDRMPPGTYNDFGLLIDALKGIDFSGFLTMEIGSGSYGRKVDPNLFAKKSIEYLRKLI